VDLNQRKSRAELLRGREVRRLVTTGLECRSVDGRVQFRGYASVTEQPYDMSWYQETVKRGAFTKTLSESPDVQLLANHEGLPLARTTNASLLLSEDARGLRFEGSADGDDPDAARLARKVEAGLLTECSFAFRVTRQTWDEDYENRDLVEVSLDRGDVSIVNYGANPHTSVSLAARSMFADLAELDEETLAQMREDPAVLTVVRRLALPSPGPEELAAIASHKTATSTKSWDGPANEARLTAGEGAASTLRKAYAWVDGAKDADTKAAYKFIHHEVGADHGVGAANLTACSAGIAVLNGGRGGTSIPAADRQGVYDHLAKHLKDGGRTPPELKAEPAGETALLDTYRARACALRLRQQQF
jgi:HK97 family phage prohead protease